MTPVSARGDSPISIRPDPRRLAPNDFVRQVAALRRPLILAHITPDADSLGASFGLASLLRDAGIDAHVGLPSGCVAKRLEFLLQLAPGVPRVTDLPAHHTFDALVVVDTANEKRINFAAGTLQQFPRSFAIDHHITNTDFCTANWIDPHAASTCEMIAILAAQAGWTLSKSSASLLYAGIHGDTAGFSLPSTNADSLHVAADLVRAGADVSHIGEQLCRSQHRADFELLRRVYDHTTIVENGRIAYSFLSHDDIVETGCKADDIDDQVSIPRALRGVQIAMLFSEGEPGIVRVNLRGEGKVTIVEIAQRFGGGGHPQSAGVRMRNRPMQEVIDTLIRAAIEHLHSLDKSGASAV